MKDKDIGILLGGVSAEREISLKTGEAMFEALKARGYRVHKVFVDGDIDRVLTDIDMPWCLKDVPWEGASMRQGFYYAVYLGTDDYGMGFVIPDAPWVNGRLREVLESILDHPYQLTPSTNPEEIHHE